jgi:hypothetical protein
MGALLSQYVLRVKRSWQEALDAFFTHTTDTEDPTGTVVEPDAAPMENPPDQDSDDPDEVDVRPSADGGPWAVGSQEAWAAPSSVATDAPEQSSCLPTTHRPPLAEGETPSAGWALAGALAAAWLEAGVRSQESGNRSQESGHEGKRLAVADP